MKDAEAILLRIPGVVEAQVFVKLLVRCEFPMTEETTVGLQEAQDWIEHETGWKSEMTVSAGKRPPTANELAGELGLAKAWKRTSDGSVLTHEAAKESETMYHTSKMRELGDAMTLLDPLRSQCVKGWHTWINDRHITTLVVECMLPLDVETAVGLQIVGQQAETDPDLELTILVSLPKEKHPLDDEIAAWEKEHPGKSFWDGAFVDSGQEL